MKLHKYFFAAAITTASLVVAAKEIIAAPKENAVSSSDAEPTPPNDCVSFADPSDWQTALNWDNETVPGAYNYDAWNDLGILRSRFSIATFTDESEASLQTLLNSINGSRTKPQHQSYWANITARAASKTVAVNPDGTIGSANNLLVQYVFEDNHSPIINNDPQKQISLMTIAASDIRVQLMRGNIELERGTTNFNPTTRVLQVYRDDRVTGDFISGVLENNIDFGVRSAQQYMLGLRGVDPISKSFLFLDAVNYANRNHSFIPGSISSDIFETLRDPEIGEVPFYELAKIVGYNHTEPIYDLLRDLYSPNQRFQFLGDMTSTRQNQNHVLMLPNGSLTEEGQRAYRSADAEVTNMPEVIPYTKWVVPGGGDSIGRVLRYGTPTQIAFLKKFFPPCVPRLIER